MLTACSLSAVESAASNMYDIAVNLDQSRPKMVLLRQKIVDLIGHAFNGSRPLQDVFTGNSIASSRVESIHSLIKRFGLGPQRSLLDDMFILRGIATYQTFYNHYRDRRLWGYLSCGEFNDVVSNSVLKGVTNEVLERMYSQFSLSFGNKYTVNKTAENGYSVKFKGNDSSRTYGIYTVSLIDGEYFCQCMIPSGYPCRHIFAVAEFLGWNPKIGLSTINTRFYLDQGCIDLDEVNKKAKDVMMASINQKNARYGPLFTERKEKDVAQAIKENKIDVDGVFEKDCTYFREMRLDASEIITRQLSHPVESSSPTLKDDVDDLEAIEGDDDEGGKSESLQSQTIICEPPTKLICTGGKTVTKVQCDIEKMIDKEMEGMSEMNLDELNKEAFKRFRSLMGKYDKGKILTAIRNIIRADFTCDDSTPK